MSLLRRHLLIQTVENISFVGGANENLSGASAYNITFGGSLKEGDFLCAMICVHNVSAFPTLSSVSGTGWTTITLGGTNGYCYFIYKIVDASTTFTYTLTFSSTAVASLTRFAARGVDPTNPVASSGSGVASTGVTYSSPSIAAPDNSAVFVMATSGSSSVTYSSSTGGFSANFHAPGAPPRGMESAIRTFTVGASGIVYTSTYTSSIAWDGGYVVMKGII